MGEYNKALAKQVEEYLKNQNWNYEFNEEDGLFRFGMSIGNKMNSCRMVVIIGGELFTSYAFSPVSADADTMAQVANYLMRANYGLKIRSEEHNV